MPSRVRFRYQLEGVDQGWVDAGARRQAFYTNLAPGHYRFRVIAANEDGIWNTKGDRPRFHPAADLRAKRPVQAGLRGRDPGAAVAGLRLATARHGRTPAHGGHRTPGRNANGSRASCTTPCCSPPRR